LKHQKRRNVTREDVERRIRESEALSSTVMGHLRAGRPMEEWEEISRRLLVVALFPVEGTGRVEIKKCQDCLTHLVYRPEGDAESRRDIDILRKIHEETPMEERLRLNIYAEHLRPRLLRAPDWSLRTTSKSTPGTERALADQRRLLSSTTHID